MSDYRESAGPLFEIAAAINDRHNALARRTDPPTSHHAARRARSFAGEHRRLILEALRQGNAGQSGIAERTGLTVAQVSKRLSELRRDGEIERCGVCRSASGGREAEYRVVAVER